VVFYIKQEITVKEQQENTSAGTIISMWIMVWRLQTRMRSNLIRRGDWHIWQLQCRRIEPDYPLGENYPEGVGKVFVDFFQ
jgi:hypothetical protein